MATTGTAYIELRAKLDQLQRDLKQAEALGVKTGDALGTGMTKSLGTKLTGLGRTLTKTLTPAALAMGAVFLKAFNDLDTGVDSIRASTGATGKELDKLTASMKKVGSQVTQPLAEVGATMGDLARRTKLTGEPLEHLTKQILDLAELTGSDASDSVRGITRLFGDWSISTDHQTAALDQLFRASQATGTSVDTLSQLLVRFGGPMRQMGFSIDEASALLAKFEQEGVNTELVMGSLRIALGKLSKEGVADLPGAFKDLVQQIKNAGSAGEANALALETFGARAGPDMAAAIREGRFAIGDLMQEIRGGKETIEGARADTVDWSDKLLMLKNRIVGIIGPFGELGFGISGLLVILGPALQGVGKLVTAIKGMRVAAVESAIGITALDVALGNLAIGAARLAVLAGTAGLAGGLTVLAFSLDTLAERLNKVIPAWGTFLEEGVKNIPIIGDAFKFASTAIDAFQDKTEDFILVAAQTGPLGKMIGEAFEASGKNAAFFSKAMGTAKDKTEDFTKLSKEEMATWRTNTVDSLSGASKEFTKLADKAKVSVEDIKGAFKELINAQINYRQNWREVAKSAGNDTDNLVQFISDRMGIDAPKALAILAGASKKEIKSLVDDLHHWQSEAKRTEGALRTIGRQSVEGWAQGIRAGGSSVVDAIVDVAQISIDGAKKRLGIKSPSKVFWDIGRDITLGLAKGIEDNLNEAIRAQEKLQRSLEKSIDGIKGRIDGLLDKLNEFRSSIKSAFSEFSVGSAFSDALSGLEEGATLTPGAIQSQVRGNLMDARRLASLLQQLASAGMSKANLMQLAAMGSDAIPVAEAILAGGTGLIAELNQATKDIRTVSGIAADSIQREVMKDEIKALNNLRDRLHELKDRLHTTNERLRDLNRRLEHIQNVIGNIQSAPSGGGGGGATGTGAGMVNRDYHNLVKVGKALQAQGYSVSEHPAFGGVSAVHTANSYHYQGRAIDVNAGAGESEAEKTKLNALASWMRSHVSPIAELIYPGTGDPDHQDHLHLAMDRGGIVRGPALIAQGNITEAHIPLGAGGETRLILQVGDREFTAYLREESAKGLMHNVQFARGA